MFRVVNANIELNTMSRSASVRPIIGAVLLVVVGAVASVLLGMKDAPVLVKVAVAAEKKAEKAPPLAENEAPAWSKQCVPSPDGQKQACFVQQFVLAAPQNTVMLKVIFSYLGPDNKPRMILEAPEGILLQQGLVLTIDTRKPLDVPLQACQTGACRAIVDMDDQALDQFTKGNVLTVRYVTADHKTIDLPVKLESLSAALKQLKS